jgi:predicted Zn-dependent protease with MMP-like domain
MTIQRMDNVGIVVDDLDDRTPRPATLGTDDHAVSREVLVLDVSAEEFEELVGAALETIPADLAAAMRNVAILVEDEPPPGGPVLLGLYEGIPLTERGEWYSGVQPDRITIFRASILRMCRTREQIVAEVTRTVVHEVGHHFGIDDQRLHELGY